MNTEAVLERLRSWARTFPGPIPTIPDIEAALRGEIDDDMRKGLRSYAGDKLWERGEVEAEALCVYAAEEWSVELFQSMINEATESIPLHLRPTAIVELCGGYDESTYLKMGYRRPQTDEEMAIAMGTALMHVMKHQADEVAVYKRLSAKFAGAPHS